MTHTNEYNGRKITLIGTAHVSEMSVKEVTDTINEINPDCVAVELDEKRADSIQNQEKYKNLDIIKVLKNNEGFLLLANLVLSSFQRRMGMNVGMKPGDEMLAAMNTAKDKNIPSVMADRPIQITLKRAWAKSSFFGKCKLLSVLIANAFSKEEMNAEEIEKIKENNEMDSMMNELSEYLPVVKEVLIDERDKYLASKIWTSSGNNIVAVIGAGHMNGVEAHLKNFAENKENDNVEDFTIIPKSAPVGKIVGWIIPILIIALIVVGFFKGGTELGGKMILNTILNTGIPSAIMTLLAAGHPLTILVAFVGAPITTLNPFIGIGLFTGITQAFICKPNVSDMETIQDDISSIKGIYKNRILRILLIFILSSIGASVGNIFNLASLFTKV
jgi:pheromone shutdown-related protein TraB